MTFARFVWVLLSFGLVLGFFAAPEAWAHGVVGQRLFLEPMVTEDANPANELDLLVPSYQPSVQGNTFNEGFSIEKTLFPMTSIGLSGAWQNVAGATGYQDPDLAIKQAIYRSPEHEAIVSVGLGAILPLGCASVGADPNFGWSPSLDFGKGLGDLPDSLSWFRPLALQGDLDGDLPFNAASAHVLNANMVVSYSLPYLQQHVQDVGIPAPFAGLMPMVEIDTTTVMAGPGAGQVTGNVLPGAIWMGPYTEVALAAMVPVNNGAASGVGVIGLLDLFLDDLLPGQFGQPLFGR